jgi:hypothetical protein
VVKRRCNVGHVIIQVTSGEGSAPQHPSHFGIPDGSNRALCSYGCERERRWTLAAPLPRWSLETTTDRCVACFSAPCAPPPWRHPAQPAHPGGLDLSVYFAAMTRPDGSRQAVVQQSIVQLPPRPDDLDPPEIAVDLDSDVLDLSVRPLTPATTTHPPRLWVTHAS